MSVSVSYFCFLIVACAGLETKIGNLETELLSTVTCNGEQNRLFTREGVETIVCLLLGKHFLVIFFLGFFSEGKWKGKERNAVHFLGFFLKSSIFGFPVPGGQWASFPFLCKLFAVMLPLAFSSVASFQFPVGFILCRR